MANINREHQERVLTAALFDRTPEQRERHTRIILKILRQSPTIGAHTASESADDIMLDEFHQDIVTLVDQRVLQQKTADQDTETARELALLGIRAEIALLHEILPLPMLEPSGIA